MSNLISRRNFLGKVALGVGGLALTACSGNTTGMLLPNNPTPTSVPTAMSSPSPIPTIRPAEPSTFSVGAFNKIFDQGADLIGTVWHINDHCFIHGTDGWHLIGITYPDPGYPNPPFGVFAHATAQSLTDSPWKKHPFALRMDPAYGETVLWAPQILKHQDLYYMFYCSGGDPKTFGISLATSSDLWSWKRTPNVLFQDGFQARDPMVTWNQEINRWVMYYCATETPSGGHHIVAYRTSEDLVLWSDREIAYVDQTVGTDYGPTESPFVVQRGAYYYLFIGPRPYADPTPTLPNWEHPGYDGTDVFASKQWNTWDEKNLIGHIQAHAAEVIQDLDGKWFVSHCGIKRGGVYLAELTWKDL